MSSTNRFKGNGWIASSAGLLLFALLAATVNAAAPSDLDSLSKEAAQNYSTKEGRSYFERFEQAIMPTFRKAMETCGGSMPDTEEPADFVFVIAADGTVKRLLYSSDIPFGECVGSKLRAIKTVPMPPRDSWVVALGAANHQHAGKPKGAPDHSIPMSEQALAAYKKAIAPYVAETRATFPAAKKRFLAGLPAGDVFSVRVPLIDSDGKREDAFIDVETIKDGKITGTIESDLSLVTTFKRGERITFPESDIDNWVIVRPNGTEEGNVVGKFLDTYRGEESGDKAPAK
jgi:uncharacterized protein YegJ (DUF2314 family)